MERREGRSREGDCREMDGKERREPGVPGARRPSLLPGQECQRLGEMPPSARHEGPLAKCSSGEWCTRVWYGCSTAAVFWTWSVL